jgi:hypothetical protein
MELIRSSTGIDIIKNPVARPENSTAPSVCLAAHAVRCCFRGGSRTGYNKTPPGISRLKIMENLNSESQPLAHGKPPSLDRLITAVGHVIVPAFSLFFLVFALLYAASAMHQFLKPIIANGDVVEGLVKGLHMGVVALAVYELSQIVYQEYDHTGAREDSTVRMRRGIIRFVSVVCVALVLEALIMVIKYSQMDLAGFLYYPVAIIASTALLLTALGVFTRLTRSAVTGSRP